MATKTKAASKPATKKRAPKEPTPVESASLRIDDAYAVLRLDGSEFRLDRVVVHQLRRDFEVAHSAINPGH